MELAARKYYYDKDDPFFGYKILWRKEDWDRCYYCGNEKPSLRCDGCAIVKYCSQDCAIIHKTNLHSEGKCAFISKFYDQWKELPIIIGHNYQMENGIFAYSDIESHQEIFTDKMLCGIYFDEKKQGNDLNEHAWTESKTIEEFKEHPKFTYAYNIVKNLYFLEAFVAHCGIYSTIAMAEKEEVTAVEKMAEKLTIDYRDKIQIGTEVQDLLRFRHIISVIYGIVKNNAFTFYTKIGNLPLLKGFFPLLSLINHSCGKSNCIAYYLGNGRVKLVSTKKIKRGEPLYMSYFHMGGLLSIWDRKIMLNSMFGFDCKCEDCNGHRECYLTDVRTCNFSSMKKYRDIRMGIQPKIDLEDDWSQITNQLNHFTKHPVCATVSLCSLTNNLVAKIRDSDYKITFSQFTNYSLIFSCAYEGLIQSHIMSGWDLFIPIQQLIHTYLMVWYLYVERDEEFSGLNILPCKKLFIDIASDKKADLMDCIKKSIIMLHFQILNNGLEFHSTHMLKELSIVVPSEATKLENFVHQEFLKIYQ